MLDQIVRGPLLVPAAGGAVAYHPDGALAADADGLLRFVGDWDQLRRELPADAPRARPSEGTMLPPLVDVHTHVPQYPIRGKFVDGVPQDAPGGRLLAGLKKNVFPAEARCHDLDCAQKVADDFLADTLANGVVGGAAYMTVSATATEIALATLPAMWSVGMVLMNQNCPDDLRTDEPSLEKDMTRLAGRFGTRVIATDRFAVAVTSPLRRRLTALAKRLGLRTQTHLNEQIGEKELVEHTLYPDIPSYTEVYHRDGLLDHRCIAAHCIHMTEAEWPILVNTGSVIAHCPSSNSLLGSGVMPLDRVLDLGIPYAIATDVGASPTVSLLAELGRFLAVHAGRSTRATPSEGLYRVTLAAAAMLGLDNQIGRLEPGRPMSFIEVDANVEPAGPIASADQAIRALVPVDLDRPRRAVRRVTLGGRLVFGMAPQSPGIPLEAANRRA